MPSYSVAFTRAAKKELGRLDGPLVERLMHAIDGLADDPRPTGTRKLQSTENLWRIRVGDYRVIYTVLDHERVVEIVAVRHRQSAYRN